MLPEKRILEALGELGYARAKRNVYKATWAASEIEHFLYLSSWKQMFTADFGLRNVEAEAFAIECVNTYADELYRGAKFDDCFRCTMRFSLGKLAGWSPRWSLYLPAQTPHGLLETIRKALDERLLPVICRVTTLQALLDLLAGDSEPCRWVYVNGAIRAAQIAYLARRLHLGSEKTAILLRPYTREVGASLKRVDPAEYIAKVVEASAKVGAGPRP